MRPCVDREILVVILQMPRLASGLAFMNDIKSRPRLLFQDSEQSEYAFWSQQKVPARSCTNPISSVQFCVIPLQFSGLCTIF